jgi:hypothetical protein
MARTQEKDLEQQKQMAKAQQGLVVTGSAKAADAADPSQTSDKEKVA